MSDDSWKDAFLLREYISGLELLGLPKEQQDWLKKYNKVFIIPLDEDGLINLLHPKNKAKRMLAKLTNVKYKPKNKV